MEGAEPSSNGTWRVAVRRRLCLRVGLWLLGRAERFAPDDAERPWVDRANRLPSVRQLADTAGVHRNTAAAVYRDLERFGLLRCVRGSGTYATRIPTLRSPNAAVTPRCSELRAVLEGELRGRLRADDGLSTTPLLVPLDASPPAGRRIVPLAPRGRSLRAVRRLRPGDDVILLSGSPRLGRLVRHVLHALHGDDVGLQRVENTAVLSTAAALVLCDTRHFLARGTTRAPAGLMKLRLVGGTGPRAG